MTKEKLKEIILKSLRSVRNESPPLNLSRVGERAIVARIAFYMNAELDSSENIHIDCEYNITGVGDPKRFDRISEELRACAKKVKRRVYDDANDDSSIRIIPDMVIHKRGTQTNNIAVIEFKIRGDSDAEFQYAKAKLQAFKDDSYAYSYTMAVLVNLASDWDEFEHSQIEFIGDGAEDVSS